MLFIQIYHQQKPDDTDRMGGVFRAVRLHRQLVRRPRTHIVRCRSGHGCRLVFCCQ